MSARQNPTDSSRALPTLQDMRGCSAKNRRSKRRIVYFVFGVQHLVLSAYWGRVISINNISYTSLSMRSIMSEMDITSRCSPISIDAMMRGRFCSLVLAKNREILAHAALCGVPDPEQCGWLIFGKKASRPFLATCLGKSNSHVRS